VVEVDKDCDGITGKLELSDDGGKIYTISPQGKISK